MNALRPALSLATAAVLALLAAAPAQAVTYTFAADMDGPSEPSASRGFGTALVTFDDVALTVSVVELWANLSGGIAGNHIHCCTATPQKGTAPIALGFTGVPATPNGFYNNTFTLGSSAFATLLSGTQAGSAYVNIHTAAYPGGEIRGWLISPVPEASSLALWLAGSAGIGLLARKRRRC